MQPPGVLRTFVLLWLTKTVFGFNCSFEQDLCGWNQPGFASTSWLREQASGLPDSISGPTSDHTFGNASGFYAVAKRQPAMNSSGTYAFAVLNSPRLPENTTAPMCFSWWYMMHETHDTTFSIYWIQNDNNSTTSTVMWRRKGNYGRRWHYAELQIEPTVNITHFSYEIAGYLNVRSTVSIDDIQLIDGTCVRSDDKSIGCTFEDEQMCGYSSSGVADFSWIRRRAATPTVESRPFEGKTLDVSAFLIRSPADHTLDTQYGYYMLAG